LTTVGSVVRSAKYPQYEESFTNVYRDKVETVIVDDLIKGDFTSALQGVDALIHVASPLPGRGSPDYTIDVSSARLWGRSSADEERARPQYTARPTSSNKPSRQA